MGRRAWAYRRCADYRYRRFFWLRVIRLSRYGRRCCTRGVDWFVFENEKIKEIREYADLGLSPEAPSVHELLQFPYQSRGYPLETTLDSKLPN